MDTLTIYLCLACLFGLLMSYGVGANDVANAIGTSVGAGVLTLRQAVVIAAVFELAGAILVGGEVTDTLRGRLLVMDNVTASRDVLICGMLAASLAAGIWLLLASYLGWPVSTTHSIVGSIIGFGVCYLGVDAIAWGMVGCIFLSWVLTPVFAGLMAFLLFYSVQRLILNSDDPLKYAKRYVPFYIALVTFVMSEVSYHSLLKRLAALPWSPLWAACLSAVAAALIGAWAMRQVAYTPGLDKAREYKKIENVFAIMMVFTACAMAFAHGANDVANAIGPMAAVVDWVGYGHPSGGVPLWILLLGGGGIVLGLVTYGYRIIATIGHQITELTPSRGFAAELSAASTVVVASHFGMPVSTTQTLVGAILGVGLARGIGALNLRVIRNIMMSWMITLPAGAVLTLILYVGLRMVIIV